MKSILLLTACAAVLTACAGPETAVRVRAAHEFGANGRTYALAQGLEGSADANDRRYTAAVERRLAELGFVAAPAQSARYRLALSHDTRPASVAVDYTGCAGGAPCGAADTGRTPGFPWPGAVAYVHSLTLRFFDRTDGKEAYKITATKRDRMPDARLAARYLVAGALARLPFEGGSAADKAATENADAGGNPADWKVTLQAAGPDAVPPRVTGITALRQ